MDAATARRRFEAEHREVLRLERLYRTSEDPRDKRALENAKQRMWYADRIGRNGRVRETTMPVDLAESIRQMYRCMAEAIERDYLS